MKRRNPFAALIVPMVLLSGVAVAGVQFFNSSSANLGNFSQVKCGNGVACSQSSGKLLMATTGSMENGETMVNSTDDTVAVLSDDSDTTFQITGFEAKSAILNLYADQGDDAGDKWSFTADTSGNLILKQNTTTIGTFATAGDLTFTKDIIGDGGDQLVGFLQSQVASTTTSATIAQCGSTFVSNSADVITLPEASTALGCRYTFVCGTADDFDVNPADGTDQISVVNSVAGGTGAAITPAAGDAIRCTDIGSSIVIEAVGADLWVTIGVGNGAWTDVN